LDTTILDFWTFNHLNTKYLHYKFAYPINLDNHGRKLHWKSKKIFSNVNKLIFILKKLSRKVVTRSKRIRSLVVLRQIWNMSILKVRLLLQVMYTLCTFSFNISQCLKLQHLKVWNKHRTTIAALNCQNEHLSKAPTIGRLFARNSQINMICCEVLQIEITIRDYSIK